MKKFLKGLSVPGLFLFFTAINLWGQSSLSLPANLIDFANIVMGFSTAVYVGFLIILMVIVIIAYGVWSFGNEYDRKQNRESLTKNVLASDTSYRFYLNFITQLVIVIGCFIAVGYVTTAAFTTVLAVILLYSAYLFFSMVKQHEHQKVMDTLAE